MPIGQEDASANKSDISVSESVRDETVIGDTDSEKLSKEELDLLFNQELKILSNALAKQPVSEQTEDDSSIQNSSLYLLQDKDIAFSPKSSYALEITPYDRDDFWSPHRPFYYPSDRFCFNRYPHWGWHRACSYGVPLWSTKITFKKRKSARQQYQEYLFDQAYGGSVRSPFILGIRYKEGFGGFPKDLSKAYAWFSIALGRGYSSAQYVIDQITEDMTQAQMDESEDIINFILETSKQVREERLEYIRKLRDIDDFQ